MRKKNCFLFFARATTNLQHKPPFFVYISGVWKKAGVDLSERWRLQAPLSIRKCALEPLPFHRACWSCAQDAFPFSVHNHSVHTERIPASKKKRCFLFKFSQKPPGTAERLYRFLLLSLWSCTVSPFCAQNKNSSGRTIETGGLVESCTCYRCRERSPGCHPKDRGPPHFGLDTPCTPTHHPPDPSRARPPRGVRDSLVHLSAQQVESFCVVIVPRILPSSALCIHLYPLPPQLQLHCAAFTLVWRFLFHIQSEQFCLFIPCRALYIPNSPNSPTYVWLCFGSPFCVQIVVACVILFFAKPMQ